MISINEMFVQAWTKAGTRFLPFADAASKELPLARLLRLSLFQVSVGMAIVMICGTLNRVMIVELGVSATLVAIMISIPFLLAPLRVLIGFGSDHYRSYLGWKRVPFLWFGTLLQFGGLAIMPFALIVLSGDTHGPLWYGQLGAGLAFLLTGIGLHMTQTAGLALATDLASVESRPRVVALLYVMLLIGMVLSSLCLGFLLHDFSQVTLIKVVQGAALMTLFINIFALWKQEARKPCANPHSVKRPKFMQAWKLFSGHSSAHRFLYAVGFGTAAFSMQDILLEPYGGEILNLSVSATTMLTVLLASGTLVACLFAARHLKKGTNPYRLAAMGSVIGISAFTAVIFAAPMNSTGLFSLGTLLIGFGGGLFAVSTLIIAMSMDTEGQSGLALGAWGAVQATAAGIGIATGGVLRDVFSELATTGSLGIAMQSTTTGYSVVYHIEIALLFVTLIILGPLVRNNSEITGFEKREFGLADFPG